MKKLCFLLFYFTMILFKGQESISYVENDFLYKGGFVNFYKEAHQIIIDKKLKPCEKKEGLYHQEFIVTSDGEFKKIENHPNVYNANKCASDLLDQILPELKNWTPAQKDGKNITAGSIFAFIPDDLFDKYEEGYDSKKQKTGVNAEAQFPSGGIGAFREEVSKNVNLDGFFGRGKISVVIRFIVELDGSVTEVVIEKSSGSNAFDERFVNAVKKVKKKWVPAKINAIPVRQRFKIPFTVNFD